MWGCPPFPVLLPTWLATPWASYTSSKTQKARSDPEWGYRVFLLPVLTQVRPLGVTHEDSLLLTDEETETREPQAQASDPDG